MDLCSERYVNLATFRRDGTEVRTPVWIAPKGRSTLMSKTMAPQSLALLPFFASSPSSSASAIIDHENTAVNVTRTRPIFAPLKILMKAPTLARG